MEENPSSTTLIDISRYCSSFADGDFWSSSSQSTHSRSPTNQRLFSPTTTTRSSDSDSPILPSLPLPPSNWSTLTSSFAQMQMESPSLSTLWSTNSSEQVEDHQHCHCCRCSNSTDKFSLTRHRPRPRMKKDEKTSFSIPTPIQRPSPSLRRNKILSNTLSIFDDEDDVKKISSHCQHSNNNDVDNDDDDGTLRLHVSNIPFQWSKEKLAEVFGKFGTTFDVEVVYNERGSKGFGFVTFLAKKDALEAKRRMDREIVDGRRLVVNFAKPKQKSSTTPKDSQNSTSKTNWKSTSISERSPRASHAQHYQSLGFSTPPTARRQHLSGFSSLSSTPTRSTATTTSTSTSTTHPSHQNYQRYYF